MLRALSDFLAFLGMNFINECVLELYFLFFDVVLRTFGPSLYESAGRSFNYNFYLMTVKLHFLDVVLQVGTFGPSLCLTYDC